MWDALADITEREGTSIHALATEINARRGETAMTSAVRVFVLAYYQRLSKEMERRLADGAAHASMSGRLVAPPLLAREVLKDIFQ